MASYKELKYDNSDVCVAISKKSVSDKNGNDFTTTYMQKNDLSFKTVTVPFSNWTNSSAPYLNEVTVSGLTSSQKLIIDLVVSIDYATAQSELSAYSFIYKIVSDTNKIIIYATEKPDLDLNLQIMVVNN